MPDQLGTAYWRMRAAEARKQADNIRDPKAKTSLLNIAANYDQIADQAEAHERSKHGIAP